MINNSTGNYSIRLRNRTKQPVYTSDKRAKFTQRENKKWIRFVTVLGYIFFVSLPAVSLSVYYIYIWDPGYINKFPAEVVNNSLPMHKKAIFSSRLERDASHVVKPTVKLAQHTSSRIHQSLTSKSSQSLDLAAILAEGSRSMEASSEVVHSPSGE